MTGSPIYQDMLRPASPGYRADQIVPHSHYSEPIDHSPGRLAGRSHRGGDANADVQSRVIDLLIEAGREAGLNNRDIAIVLAIAGRESGFNPDAAAGTTSAYGLGQFVNDTGAAYGLSRANRRDAGEQARALVAHFVDNKHRAQSHGQGEEYIYKYHHDGPSRDYGGLAISREHVMPYVGRYEAFVDRWMRNRGISQARGPHASGHGRTPTDEGAHARHAAAPHARGPRPARHHTQSRHHAHGAHLRYGDSGAAVGHLQAQLNAHGIRDAQGRALPTTEHFREKTQAAVAEFQRLHGLPVTGVADPATLEALAKSPLVKRGDHGSAVMRVQQMLERAGIPVPATGDFTYLTEGAVKDFQTNHGLEPTGVVGGETLYRLRRAGEAVSKPAHDAAGARAPGGDGSEGAPPVREHPLVTQARPHVEALDHTVGRGGDAYTGNLIAGVAATAQAAGLTRIDDVVLSTGRDRLIAVQGEGEARRMASVDIREAMATPAQVSLARLDAMPAPITAPPVTSPRVESDEVASGRAALRMA